MAKKTTKRAAKKTTGSKTTRKAAKRTRKAAKGARKTTKSAKRTRKAAKRELIDTGSDTRYVRRGARGRFDESDDVGRSLTSDRRTKARTTVKRGQGDKGDR